MFHNANGRSFLCQGVILSDVAVAPSGTATSKGVMNSRSFMVLISITGSTMLCKGQATYSENASCSRIFNYFQISQYPRAYFLGDVCRKG